MAIGKTQTLAPGTELVGRDKRSEYSWPSLGRAKEGSKR